MVLTLWHFVLWYAADHIGFVLRLNIQYIHFWIHFVMTQVQFADRHRTRLLHLGARIFISQRTYVAHWGHFAYSRTQCAPVAAIADII